MDTAENFFYKFFEENHKELKLFREFNIKIKSTINSFKYCFNYQCTATEEALKINSPFFGYIKAFSRLFHNILVPYEDLLKDSEEKYDTFIQYFENAKNELMNTYQSNILKSSELLNKIKGKSSECSNSINLLGIYNFKIQALSNKNIPSKKGINKELKYRGKYY